LKSINIYKGKFLEIFSKQIYYKCIEIPDIKRCKYNFKAITQSETNNEIPIIIRYEFIKSMRVIINYKNKLLSVGINIYILNDENRFYYMHTFL